MESCLPYNSAEDLPPSLRAHLPLHAQEIFRGAFNNAWLQYQDRGATQQEEIAHRIAWAAVKRRYRKEGVDWVPKI